MLPLLLLVFVVLSYAGSFRGAFVLDDTKKILSRPEIRGVDRFVESGWFKRRFVTDFTFALNYESGRFMPPDYHATNLAIHLAAAFFLYGFVRRTLRLPGTAALLRRAATPVALFSALFWAVHPLTTSSVTYVCQRYEALMGMFYFLCLYAVVRAAGAARAWPWYALGVAAAALGVASKEVMITVPIVVLAYDRLFLTGSYREIIAKRWPLYLGLALVWALAAALLATGVPHTFVESGAAKASGRAFTYALTQGGVIVHYLRLSIWPDSLCLDYAWPSVESLGSALPAVAFVAGLGLVTLWGLYRSSRTAFLGVWFFAILAPTSSFLPRPDFAFEHRMYLPLVSVTTGAAVGGYALLGALVERGWIRARFAIAVAAAGALVIAGALGTATHLRNRVFHSPERVWRDAVARRPENLRARTAVAASLLKQGRFTEAESEAREVLRRADVMLASRKVRRAVAASNPRLYHAAAHNQIGLALLGLKRAEESLDHFAEAISTAGGHKSSHLFDRALAYRVLGREEDALADLRASLDLKPDEEKTHAMIGKGLADAGRHQEALIHYERALTLAPGFEWVKVELAWLLATSPDDNVRDGAKALAIIRATDRELKPGSVRAMEVMAAAYAETGDFAKALDVAEAAASLALERGKAVDGSASDLYRQGRTFRDSGGRSRPE